MRNLRLAAITINYASGQRIAVAINLVLNCSPTSANANDGRLLVVALPGRGLPLDCKRQVTSH